MKIKILESAKQDLREGFDFYESQEKGIGSYFLESLFSHIESLRLFGGIHPILFDRYHRLLSKRFPSPYTIVSRRIMQKSMLFLTADEILHG